MVFTSNPSARPLLLSTWSNSRAALAAAWPALAAGGSALDAVETAIRFAEADLTNATVGVGGLPDRDGSVSLDAAIMLSPARAGAVCAVRRAVHPITVARCVMERTPHKLLAGEAADRFAIEQGLETGELLTESAGGRWEAWRASNASAQPIANIEETKHDQSNHDTIGVLAIDGAGLLVAGCSTSGLAWKLPGRVGDSPIIGQGLYADPGVGACVCTGHGELAAGICAAFLAVECLRQGGSPGDAVGEVLSRLNRSYRLTPLDQIGVIVVAADGSFSTGSLRTGFIIAVRTFERDELLEPEVVLL
jgi:isoaspartyl peptidase/L-asparaginase-like protein (Ntn-hydrolase superfamily)